MITPHRIALTLLAVGLGLGTIADWIPDRPPQPWGDRLMLAADLHVHGFPGDGAIGPFNIGREARRRGLDAIALTNHNQVRVSRVAHWWSQHVGGALVLPGQEVTNPGYHIAAVGIRRVVDWRPDTPDASIAAIHAQGGVAIAAHPEKPYFRSFDGAPLRALDGAERRHPVIYRRPEAQGELEDFFAHVQNHRDRPLAAIGSSDFHTAAALGRCRTFVLARELSEGAILDAIREGKTIAHADGEPLPDQALRGRLPAPRASGVLGWLGLVGLLLFRSERRRA
jgi:predicted metal-dependent phosphoesterase TrpH